MKSGKILFPVIFLFMVPVFILQGCGTKKVAYSPTTIPPITSRIDLTDIQAVKSVLYSQYNEWKSVRYREGGLSKKGVDCSGYVYLTYRSKFGIDLPRTTDSQSSLGIKISQDNLKAGDLVFFKTGLFKKHVGIFLEDRKFMHASTSKGVIISSLDEEYWSDNYWKAKRIYQ